VESVRPATRDDLVRCAELLERARTDAQSRRGGARLLEAAPAADALALAEWLGHDERQLFVGEFSGAVVGVAAGSVERPARRGQVVWCYVEAPARGVGVGTALVGALAEWFTAAGCTEMEAVALPGDRSTKQLYEAGGLKARLLVMHRSLP
jgi:GNAT superfamily N-acetyltransferase